MSNKKPNHLRGYLVNTMPISSRNCLSKEDLALLDGIDKLISETMPEKKKPYVRAYKYDPIHKKVIKIINPDEPIISHE